MADKSGLCRVCGRIGRHTCKLCGRFVCDADYDTGMQICVICKKGGMARA